MSNNESRIIFKKIVLFYISIKTLKHLVCCGHYRFGWHWKSLYTNHLKSFQLIEKHILSVIHLFIHTITLNSPTNKANFALKFFLIFHIFFTQSHFLKEVVDFAICQTREPPWHWNQYCHHGLAVFQISSNYFWYQNVFWMKSVHLIVFVFWMSHVELPKYNLNVIMYSSQTIILWNAFNLQPKACLVRC